jgi:hypothetical protein
LRTGLAFCLEHVPECSFVNLKPRFLSAGSLTERARARSQPHRLRAHRQRPPRPLAMPLPRSSSAPRALAVYILALHALALCSHSSAADATAAAPTSASTSSTDAPSAAVTGTSYPRNLHRVYDGTWEVSGRTAASVPPFSAVPRGSAAANATASKRYERTLAFDKKSGFALLTAENHESALGDDVNIVFGDLLIRDGAYRSPHDVSLRLMGVYEWQTGKLVLVGDLLYEDTSVALTRLYAAATRSSAPQMESLRSHNVSEARFVDALTPAFAKHRKHFRAGQQRSVIVPGPVSGASAALSATAAITSPSPSQSDSNTKSPPRRPSIAAQCPFALSLSVVAARFDDQLPATPDYSTAFVPPSSAAAAAVAGVAPPSVQDQRRESASSILSVGHPLAPAGPSDVISASIPSGPIGSLSGSADALAASKNGDSSLETASEPRRGSGSNGGGQDELVEMNGLFSSEECETELNIVLSTLDTETLFGKAINYTLLVTFVSFMQVVVLIRQMEMTSTQAGASRVSLMTVGLQAVADSYLCLGHLTMGIAVPSLFNAFATAAFFKFIIFSIFEMRYMLLIWKARRPSGFSEGWEAMRRELSMLYSRFYGSLLFGIVLLYQMQNHLRYFMFALYSFWLPQIILSIVEDNRKPLHPVYIAGMSLTRLLIPCVSDLLPPVSTVFLFDFLIQPNNLLLIVLRFSLYMWGCPNNFLHIKPQYSTALALVAWVGLQAATLFSQHRWGPRWFVPKQLLPEKYDYYRAVLDSSVVDDLSCSDDGSDDALDSGIAGDIEAGGGDGQALLGAKKRVSRRRRDRPPAEVYVELFIGCLRFRFFRCWFTCWLTYFPRLPLVSCSGMKLVVNVSSACRLCRSNRLIVW